jgi:hypothetical protein
MYTPFPSWFVLSFCATDHRATVSMLQFASSAFAGRAALNTLMPGFPSNPAELPQYPVGPIPTDVPMPGPMDVPAHEPRDVPAPDPGRIPPETKPRPDEKNPKPRSVP